MMKMTIFGATAVGVGLAVGGVKSGHAEADLISAGTGYQPEQPVQLALRLKLDKGWHSYWLNPGDSGMPVSIEWSLPDGWAAGPLLYPVPERFSTSGAVGFGYADEVVMPVFLTPGPDATGQVVVSAKVDWLTCDDAACVPGSAELKLELEEGVGKPTSEADEIDEAFEGVPQPLAGAQMTVASGEDDLVLGITLPDSVNGEGAELIAATPNVADVSKKVILGPSNDGWKVTLPKHEYLEADPKELDVLLIGGELKKPLMLSWKAEK